MNSLASTTLRGLAAGTVITALSAAVFAGPAAAETRIFPDARGDIAHGADIYRVRVANGAEMVRIKVVHRNLRRTFRSGSSLTVFLDTDRRDRGPEYVFSGGTFEGSDYALTKTDGWRLADRANQPMRCDYDMKLDYVKETALVRISRSCLSNPHAVRVAVKTGGEHVNKAGETTKIEVDWLGKPRQFTPWVKRG